MLRALSKGGRQTPVTMTTAPKRDHPIEGFLFDGAHESLAMRIQIRTSRGQDNSFPPLSFSSLSKVCVNCVSLSWIGSTTTHENRIYKATSQSLQSRHLKGM